MPTSTRRHPLLIYARLFAVWRTPALLIAVMCMLLAWLAPGGLADDRLRILLALGAGAGWLLFGYTIIAPRQTYVQCQPTHLRVSLPLFRLAISYSRINTTRPVAFNPANVSWTQETAIRSLRGMTMVAVDLTGYPLARRWLRLVLNEFVLPDNFLGLQFLVPDWMALSRDIDVHRSQWATRDRDRSRGDALTSLMGPPRF